MKDPRGHDFDKMIARIDTTHLTSNTTKVTELPDEFEPNDMNALNFARMIP